MSLTLLNPTPVRQTDSTGTVAPGALLYTYVANTTTPQATYTDGTGLTPLSNPVVADSSGLFPSIWVASAAYDLVCKTASGTLLWQVLGYAPSTNINGYTQISVSGANTLIGTVIPSLSSYQSGQQFQFVAASNNTGSVTLNINGLGPVQVNRPDGSSLLPGDIVANQLVQVYYNGSYFQYLNPISLPISGGTLTGPVTLAANAIQPLQAVPLQQLQQYVPIGSIIDFGSETAPAGWLECDGSSLPRVGTYANLFAVIGTTYGAVDANHFNIPDHRGKFKRGWNHGTGNDPDAATRTAQGTGGVTGDHVGSVQGWQNAAHVHDIYTNREGGSGGPTGNVRDNFNGVGSAHGQGTWPSGGKQANPINANVMSIIKVQ